MNIPSRLVLLLFFHFPFLSFGQSAIPSDIKLNRISNQYVNVIYEHGMDSSAFRIAKNVSFLRQFGVKSIDSTRLGPIDILLHNHTTIPNGFVALAPFRSEFFGTPLQDMTSLTGTMSWLDLLAIHEYRHVQQYYHSKVGFTKFLSFAFGDFGQALGLNATLPDWYFEGDAVVYESALSQSGRGRLPYFLREYKALLADSTFISYDQARFGSFVMPSPNHYKLGYLMQSYGRNQFGQNLWQVIAERSGRWKPLVLSTTRNVYKQTGLTNRKMFKAISDSLLAKWKDLYATETNYTTINEKPKKRELIHYQFPHIHKSRKLFALKSTTQRTPEIVELAPNNQEVSVTSIGSTAHPYLSLRGNTFMWTELSLDQRWEYRNYSDVYSFDLETRQKKRLTHQKKYFSPHLSQKEDRIAVVSYAPDLRPQIRILNNDGSETETNISFPLEASVSFPIWLPQDSSIVYVKTYHEKTSMEIWNPKTNHGAVLIKPVNHVISFPKLVGDYIYFGATFRGQDDIFRISLKDTKQVELVAQSFLGAYTPEASDDSLFFSAYTPKGSVLAKTNLDPQPFVIEPSASLVDHFPDIQTISEFEGGPISQRIDSVAYEFQTEEYRKTSGLLNTHSWAPELLDPIFAFSFFTTNLTQTLSMKSSIFYNRNDDGIGGAIEAAYSGWFPVIFLKANYWDGRSLNSFGQFDEVLATRANPRTNDSQLSLGIGIPLRQIKGNYVRTLSTRLDFGGMAFRTYNSFPFSSKETINEGSFGFSEFTLSLSNVRRKASQQIYSPFSQRFTLGYKQSVFENDLLISPQFISNLAFTFPGLHPTNNSLLSFSYRWNDRNKINFFNETFMYPRGYNPTDLRLPGEFFIASAGYALPLFYPHWNILGLSYINRVRAQFFADAGFARNMTPELTEDLPLSLLNNKDLFDREFRSVSAELVLDMVALRTAPISLLLRVSRLFDEHGDFSKNTNSFTFVVSSQF